MSKAEKLTMIMPCFARSQSAVELVQRAYESIVEQKIALDVIIIDDCSPYPIQVASHGESNVNLQIIRNQNNLGAGASRNLGMKQAQTSLISFLDYDDILLPDTLSARLELALSDTITPNLIDDPKQIQGCGWREVMENGEQRQIRFPRGSHIVDDFFRGSWFCPGSTIIANRHFLLDELGGFDPYLRRLEDAEFFLRAGQAGAQFSPIPILGAQILYHDAKSPSDIQSACAYIRQTYLRTPTKSGVRLSKRQKCLLKAYLATENARLALKSRQYLKLAFYGIQYLSLMPDRSPRWGRSFKDVVK